MMLMDRRGGPAKMLQSSLPTPLADGVTVSAARLNLEILAIYETMGCLTTSEEPMLLSDRWESWWFESSRSTYEEHSVEKQFGMSRTMVHLFSRLTRLLSRVKRSTSIITEAEPFASSALTGDPLVLEARKLNADVDAWIESLQITSLEHERVQVGNRAYAHAMKVSNTISLLAGLVRRTIKLTCFRSCSSAMSSSTPDSTCVCRTRRTRC